MSGMKIVSARVLALAMAALVVPAAVADEKWVRKGPGSTYVRGVRAFPNTPAAGQTTVFVATLSGGIFKFVDSAGGPTNPVAANAGLPQAPYGRIRQVAASTINALYAVDETYGIYKSTDQGATWAPANGSGGGALPCVRTRGAAAFSDTTLFVGTACAHSSGVFKTTDGGATWSKLGGATLPDDVFVNSVNVNSTGAVILVSTTRYGIFRSGDSGATFAKINGNIPMPDGPDNLNVFNTQFGATAATMLAYVDGQGMFRTTDTGSTWAAVNTGLPGTVIVSGSSREGSTSFFVGVDGQGIYRSTDGGISWSLWGNTATDGRRFTRGVTADSSAPGRYYASTMEGLYRTTDSGATWSDVYIDAGHANSIAIAPDGKTAYMAGATLYKSSDVFASVLSASPADSGLPGSTIDSVAGVDRNAPSTVYVSLPRFGLYKSTNAGANWSKLANLPQPNGSGLNFRIDPLATQTIYAALTNPFRLAGGGGMQKSTDGGATWAAINNGLGTPLARDVNTLRVSSLAAGTVFIATDGGLFRTTDGGANWALVYSVNDGNGQPMPIRYVETDWTNPNLVFMANDHANPDGTLRASSGILRSTDGGATWNVVLPNVRGRQVRTQRNGEIVATADRGSGQPGVYRSSDGGATWVPFTKGLRSQDIDHVTQLSDGGRATVLSTREGIYTLAVDKDTNADGKADLFWRQAAPGLGLSWWTMNGNATVGANYHEVDSSWQIADVGDLDGDGRADVIWRRASDGANYLWTLDGLGFKGFFDLGILDPAQWTLTGIADLDGDGKGDVIWRGADGTVYGWLMNGGTIVNQGVVVNPGTQWVIADLADMDGDGRADIVFRNVNDGGVFIYFMNGLSIASGAFVGIVDPAAWTLLGAADFSGDGKADLLWRHTSGDTWVWLMNGGAFQSAGGIGNPGTSWSVKSLADMDGDGKVDLVWRHTDGTTYLWKMNGASVSSFLPVANPGGSWNVVAP